MIQALIKGMEISLVVMISVHSGAWPVVPVLTDVNHVKLGVRLAVEKDTIVRFGIQTYRRMHRLEA